LEKCELRKDYSTEAKDYDQKRFEGEKGEFLSRTDNAIIRELTRITNTSLCLDMPVGSGRVSTYLRDEPINIIGCDYTKEMLSVTKQRSDANGQIVVQADAAKLPFKSNSLELIICLNFFHLFPAPFRGIFSAELDRVIKPGGFLLCSFTNGWYGGGLSWMRKSLSDLKVIKKVLGDCSIYFLTRGEISKLFPTWRVCKSRGNYLPFQRLTAHLGRNIERTAQWLTARTPLKRFCFARFYLLRKPE